MEYLCNKSSNSCSGLVNFSLNFSSTVGGSGSTLVSSGSGGALLLVSPSSITALFSGFFNPLQFSYNLLRV